MSGALHGVLASLKAAAGAATDAFFKYVSLLLNTSATNGAQNNTFLDSSTNAFSITRNGNTTQGTFSPFSQTGWSNYFDGAGDWLSVPDNAAFDLAAGDFTIETWTNFSALPVASDAMVIVAQWPGVGSTNYGWLTYLFNSAGTYQVVFSYSTTGSNQINLSVNLASAPNIGVWNHWAFVRSGNNYLFFLNGTQVGSTQTLNATIFNSSLVVTIGRLDSGSFLYPFNGYLSNVRIVKGTAVYTSAFTPPTAPLTAITNTSLLTCQSNRFIDNSANAFAITRNGDVSVQAFSPFAPTAAWSASTNGGSGYFDGTGDYLTTPTTTALSFGTGDFTVECWVYKTTAANSSIIDGRVNPGGAAPWAFYVDASNFPYFYEGTIYTSSIAVSLNTWTHVAATRSSGTLRIFVNGVQGYSATVTTNLDRTAGAFIGAAANTVTPQAFYQGFMCDLRVVKGTAVYTANFTPPTAPLTAITNTSLLLNFTNAGIFDSASGNDLETVGNAQVSTTQAKWGTTSMAFDGTGDWLVVPNRQALRLGAADFTIEYWFYPTNLTGTRTHMNTDSGAGGVTCSYAILTSGSSLVFYLSSNGTTWNLANGVSMGTATLNTWQHVALVRSGSTFTPYLNGVAGTTATSTASLFDFTAPLSIGAALGGGSPIEFLGYIDDLRFTKGYARYTANFTPPTAAFPVQ